MRSSLALLVITIGLGSSGCADKKIPWPPSLDAGNGAPRVDATVAVSPADGGPAPDLAAPEVNGAQDAAAPDPAPPPLTALCDGVCGEPRFVFPASFCLDLWGEESQAPFCTPGGRPLDDESCVAFCRRTLAAAPPGRCSDGYRRVMNLIIDAGSFNAFAAQNGEPTTAGQMALLDMVSGCWAGPYFERERQLWRERRPNVYRFVMYQQTFGAGMSRAQVSVDGAATALGPSIDRLYDELAACLARPGHSVFLETDPLWHHPVRAGCMTPKAERTWPSVAEPFYRVEDFVASP